MLEQLITFLVRRYKNPNFKFDEGVDLSTIISLILIRIIAKIRSYKMILWFKWPKGIFLGKGVDFFCMSNISIGSFVTLGRYTYISGLGRNGVKIGNRVNIGDFSKIVVSTSFNNIGDGIVINDDVGIGEFSYIGGAGGTEIGGGCIIGQYFSVHPENHIFTALDIDIREQGVVREGVKIGMNCWIGSKVTVLDGAKIGNGCVVAAGAVVKGEFPDNVVIAGVPAKVISERIK